MLARHDEASSKYEYTYEASFEYEENTGEASKAEWNKKRELPGCERIVSDKGGWLLGQGKSTIHQVCAQVLNDLSSGKLS